MSDDRNKALISGHNITQLFVSRSKKLRDHVSRYHKDYCSDIEGEGRVEEAQADFFTLEQFLVRMTRIISEAHSHLSFDYSDKASNVGYENFTKMFYDTLDRKKHTLHPSIVWTQIRSCLKGSIESFFYAREKYAEGQRNVRSFMLPLETYLSFSKKRVRLEECDRRKVYDVAVLYTEWLLSAGLWDDDDRAIELCLISNLNRDLDYANRSAGAYDKVCSLYGTILVLYHF